MRWDNIVELTGYDHPAEFDRFRPNGKIVAKLVRDIVEHFPRQRFFGCALLIKKTDLAQYRVPRWSLRRTVDDPDLMPELAGDLGQHTRIGCNSRTLFKREIKSVEDNVGHSEPRRCASF